MLAMFSIKKHPVQVLLFAYILGIFYWAWMHATGNIGTVAPFLPNILFLNHADLWSLVFPGILPLLSGLFGIMLSKKWGFLSASLGRAIFFISVGLFMWGLGSVTFSYYNIVLDIAVPYPSLADVGFVLGPPFWIIGLFNLGKGIGAGYKMRAPRGKVIIALIVVFGLSVSYYLLVSVARSGVFDFTESGILKVTLDVLYPLFDTFLLTLIILI
ncbi:MAG: hypothetical protein Q8R55_07675, partial [Candidatus Taylorbacteria bacterium]|nr:hypothetical protein [Candidatus Taylorbacteria bacterium]